MLKLNLCDYGDAHIPVKETITITGQGTDAVAREVDKNITGVDKSLEN